MMIDGCNEEFSPDPDFSDTCGSEVTCGRCGTCTAHCRCERKPDLDRARDIAANLIKELHALEGWPSPDASREERATFYGCDVNDVEARS